MTYTGKEVDLSIETPGVETGAPPLAVEDPVKPPPTKGLVPRSVFVVPFILVLIVLTGFFIRDMMSGGMQRGGKEAAEERQIAASAPKGVNLANAPSGGDIERIASEAAKAASAAAAKSGYDNAETTSNNGGGGLAPMAVVGPEGGAPVKAQDGAPLGSGRPPKDPAGLNVAGQRMTNSGGDASATSAQLLEVRWQAPIMALDGGGEDVPPQETRINSSSRRAERVIQQRQDPYVQSGSMPDIAKHESDVEALQRQGTDGQSQLLEALARSGLPGAPVQSQASAHKQWLNDYSKSGSDKGDVSSVRQMQTRALMLQGSRIPVVSIEAINSDMPGQITARSTVDVYDTLNQSQVVLPKHTRFIGSYSAEIRPGQTRLLMAFNRAVTPDGRSIDLSSAQAVDNMGRAGVEGEVDNHFLKMFGHSLAVAWISSKMSNKDGLQTSTSGPMQTTNTTIAGQVLGQITQQILQRNASIPPTITRDAGMPFSIVLSKDLILEKGGFNGR